MPQFSSELWIESSQEPLLVRRSTLFNKDKFQNARWTMGKKKTFHPVGLEGPHHFGLRHAKDLGSLVVIQDRKCSENSVQMEKNRFFNEH